MAQTVAVEDLAERLCWEVRELSLGTSGEIERIQGAPTSLRFLRDFVLPNKPCIITDAIDHWPALVAWTNAYLRASLADQCVSVHSTPNGFADAVVDLDRLRCTTRSGTVKLPAMGNAHSSLKQGDDGARGLCRRPSHGQELDAVETGNGRRTSEHGNCSAVGLYRCSSLGQTTSSVDAMETKTVHMEFSKHGQGSVVGLSGCLSCGVELSSADAMEGCEEVCSLRSDLPREATNDMCSYEESPEQAWFAVAYVERVPFSVALDMILHSEIGSGVAYAQEQNGCFLTDYSALAADADTHFAWATEAFGCLPEAVNIWIGNEKAVTSFHKDHYENLYAVIAGEKHFTLLPPTDLHRLYIREYPCARYVKHEGRFAIEQEKPAKFIPWASVDPYPPDELVWEAKSKFPKYFEGPKPFTCTLQAGEILYLPSLWFHHVRQSPDLEGRTIALNFWYDMQFDIKYAYHNFLESLINKS